MFEMSENIGDLAKALSAAQAEYNALTKNKTADMEKYTYDYADLAAVLDGCRPQLNAKGIAVVQAPYVGDDGGIGISTCLMHSSGQWISGKISHSMALKKWQDLGAALTFMRRYALSAMAGVASEEDTDGADLKPAPQRRKAQEPEPEPEPTWAEKSQKIADAVKSAATSEAVAAALKVFTSDLQWLHDHKPHYYERLMEVAKEREDELRNVTELAG